MLIYHGSKCIIKQPLFGEGKANNDYGKGFYCTQDISLASEWAVDKGRDGFVNCYELDSSSLKVLDLGSPEYCLMEWLALLLTYREVETYYPLQREAKRYILENFSIDIRDYDMIKGYRADDSYFTFARDFLNGAISYSQLGEAMRLGKLGEQVVLKSRKAFETVYYSGSIKVSSEEWYIKKQQRDIAARREYANRNTMQYVRGGLYIVQIIDGEMKKDDLRLR